MKKKFLIKIDHMCVCPPCAGFVEELLEKLGITDFEVFMGGVELKFPLSNEQWKELRSRLMTKGLLLFRFSDCELIEQIKLAARRWMYAKSGVDTKNRCDFIADHCGRNFAELDECFMKETGMSIEDFCIDDKLNCAVGLLENTNLPIGEIIVLLNYHSDALFYRQFKRREGVSPAVYRSQLK